MTASAQINRMVEAALKRLRHSIGTKAGKHKARVRENFARLRAEKGLK